MINSQERVALLSDPDLLVRTHELVDHSQCTEADLLVHLGEIDQRKLYLEHAFETKREIEELVARLAPQPAVAPTVRKLPERTAPASAEPLAFVLDPAPARPPVREDRRPAIAPLAEQTYRVQFTASRELRDKLRQAQDLLRHRVPDGDASARCRSHPAALP